MKVCDESLYHEIAVIYCFLHLYERMETMEGEALDFITRDFDAWKWRREQRRQSEKKIKRVFVIGDTGIYPLFGFFSYAAFLLSYVDGKRNEYTWFYCCFCGMVLLTVTCFYYGFGRKRGKRTVPS